MISKTLNLLLLLNISLLFNTCDLNTPGRNSRVVIGISADVQTFNPLFAMSVDEGVVVELLYLSLFDFRWNEERGDLEISPLLAERWEWSGDSSSIRIFLRDDAYWTDGKQLTASDVVFSFDVYSDPVVQSRLYGTFRNLYVDDENHIDPEKTFDIYSPFEFTINFPPGSLPGLYEISFQIVPEHIFGNVKREELSNSVYNFNPVSSGSYYLKKWDRNQTITLAANEKSFQYKDEQIKELIFKVVPDYTSRIIQLNKGEIDLVEMIKVEDLEEFRNNDMLKVVPVVGREYDYVGLNNIDPAAYKDGKVIQNKYFGSRNVRKAITYAINREEILSEYLLGYGELAAAPVSPIFKAEFNEQIKPYGYNPIKAKELLAAGGWKDLNGDGIIEKGNTEFSFTLYYPAGNPLREFASMVIRNNLKAVGINVKLETVESGTLIDFLFERRLDAWMSGWYIPIPVELKPYWSSDLENTPLNFSGYRNKQVDSLLNLLETKISVEKKTSIIKTFQEIIHEDEPVTFLYWIPNVCVYNKRITNINITPLGTVTHCWEWRIK